MANKYVFNKVYTYQIGKIYKNLTVLNVDRIVENQDLLPNACGNFIVFLHC